MKKPKQVKVVRSDPDGDQDGIDALIGNTYSVADFDKDTKTVYVVLEEMGGQIGLNPGEYEVVE